MSSAQIYQVAIAIIIGVSVGVISSRMYKISWDEHEAEVIGKIDIYGIIVLVLFVLFELNKGYIASLLTSDESIGAIGLTLLTAALYGRIFATGRTILRILRSEKIISG